jgi:hypothetical protein
MDGPIRCSSPTLERGKDLKTMKMAIIIALMMEAARTSETSVNFYQTTRRYNPQYSHVLTRRRENPKFT